MGWEIKEFMFLERRPQNESTESKITQFGLIFAEKWKSEKWEKFRSQRQGND